MYPLLNSLFVLSSLTSVILKQSAPTEQNIITIHKNENTTTTIRNNMTNPFLSLIQHNRQYFQDHGFPKLDEPDDDAGADFKGFCMIVHPIEGSVDDMRAALPCSAIDDTCGGIVVMYASNFPLAIGVQGPYFGLHCGRQVIL